ncbi:hypothetical protein AWB98_06520 [Mycolicibacterium conceptionense]|uniref:Integral membrane protein n=1 Tax=Mycolicibacterium conceptionense TaxID=451644 RepID=A0ABX3VAX7_9MYCO|nr:TIGR02206 family membrane protein [Mycolicibacterium conceptionense]ORV29041.1 hypothetical protein AWB98_06520 [Mycolicibacterium conceptionense]
MTVLSQRQFTTYGPSHWAAIAVFVVGAVVLVWLGRRQNERQARVLGRVLATVTASTYVAMFVYTLIPPSVERSVPLRLTDLATVVGAYALWSQRHWAFVLTYYWGLVLSTQALVSPVLKSPDFPHYEFLAFWSVHLFVVWAAIYLTWGRGMRPNWRDYRLVVAVTGVWAVVTMAFNALAGTNYGFLNAKPSTVSLLDLMGPWPVYVLVASALVAGVWALMTWPWVRRSRRAVRATPE